MWDPDAHRVRILRAVDHLTAEVRVCLEGVRPLSDIPAHRLRLSELGYCPRRTAYRLLRHGEHPRPPGDMLTLAAGRWYEALLVAAMDQAGYHLVGTGADQIPLACDDPPAYGYPDGLVWDADAGALAVLEIKSAGASAFQRLRRQGVARSHPQYADQAQVYLALTGLPWAWFVVVCRAYPDLFVERLAARPARAQALLARGRAVWAAVQQGELPDPEPGDACRYCPYRAICPATRDGEGDPDLLEVI